MTPTGWLTRQRSELGGQRPPIGLEAPIIFLDVCTDLLVLLPPLLFPLLFHFFWCAGHTHTKGHHSIVSFQQQLNFLCILIGTWKLAETRKALFQWYVNFYAVCSTSLSCNWEGYHNVCPNDWCKKQSGVVFMVFGEKGGGVLFI